MCSNRSSSVGCWRRQRRWDFPPSLAVTSPSLCLCWRHAASMSVTVVSLSNPPLFITGRDSSPTQTPAKTSTPYLSVDSVQTHSKTSRRVSQTPNGGTHGVAPAGETARLQVGSRPRHMTSSPTWDTALFRDRRLKHLKSYAHRSVFHSHTLPQSFTSPQFRSLTSQAVGHCRFVNLLEHICIAPWLRRLRLRLRV